LKNSYPAELAKYAVKHNLQHEPAFSWWIDHTLKKQNLIISKLKSRCWERAKKIGIRLLRTNKEAIEIDIINKNTLWQDAIKLEMKNNRIAFEIYNGDPNTFIGYQECTTHLIFDIKMSENFRRKARLVADGHKTKSPAAMTYSSVISHNSVRICLLIAILNNVDILCGDIQNAYLTAPNKEAKL